MQVRRIELVALVLLMLVGCSSAPTQDKIATPRLVPSNWWYGFNDDQLNILIDTALANNPDLASSKASLRAARARRNIASAALLPSLNAGVSAVDTDGQDSYSTGLDTSWELDIFGVNRSARSAASADVVEVLANVDDLQLSLVAELINTYVNLRQRELSLALTKANITAQQETVQLVQAQRSVGLGSEPQLLQGLLVLGQLQAQVPALESDIAAYQYALARLCGQQPDSELLVISTPVVLPQAPPVVLDIPANAIRQRPDIRAAEAALSAANARQRAAQRNLYPNFSLGGSLNYSSLDVGDLFDPANQVRQWLASISAPLFQGGSLRAQVQLQTAALDQAEAAYRKTVLLALEDIAKVLASLKALDSQLPQLEHNLSIARSSEQLSLSAYEVGTGDFNDVLDARRSRISTENSLLSAQASKTIYLVSLYKAVGGDWQEQTYYE